MRSKFILLLALVPLLSFGQNSIEYNTGLQNIMTWGFIESISDSTLRCGYYVGQNGNAEAIIARTIRKSDLVATDSNIVWQRNGRFINIEGGLYFQTSNSTNYYVDTWQNDSNDVTSYVAIYYLNADKTPGSHLFTKKWDGWQIKGPPRIIGDSMYVLLSRITFSDTTYVEIYNLQGVLVAKKFYDYQTILGYTVNSLFHSIEKDSILVVSDKLGSELVLIDRYSLDTVNTIRPDQVFLANHEYGSFYPGETYIHKHYISQLGRVSMLFGISSGNINLDGQIFYDRRSYNGDSLYLVNLGPKHIDNDAFAFWEDPTSARPNFIAAGRLPEHPTLMPSLPNEVIIYHHNQFGTDSILLFGTQNHVPRSLFADSNGDLYMFSTYTMVNSTGLTKGVLTKIPAFIIGLIENKLVSPQIVLYPNPSTDWVKFEVGEKNIELLEVYSQQGQLLLREENPATNEISIANLPASIYIVVAKLEKGESFSALVKKE